jgi:hypothetical protein
MRDIGVGLYVRVLVWEGDAFEEMFEVFGIFITAFISFLFIGFT